MNYEALKAQGSFAEATSQAQRPDWDAWAEHHLPGQHVAFAATAASLLNSGGWPVTPAAVLDRLRAAGRTREQLERRAIEEGDEALLAELRAAAPVGGRR